jgi:hypothetical protein
LIFSAFDEEHENFYSFSLTTPLELDIIVSLKIELSGSESKNSYLPETPEVELCQFHKSSLAFISSSGSLFKSCPYILNTGDN